MRIYLKNLVLILLPFMAIVVGSQSSVAQNATPGMVRFSQMEERTLQLRRSLLELEAETQSPIWIKDAQGLFEIIDGEKLRARIGGLSSIAELMIVDGLTIEGAGFLNDIMAGMVAEKIRGVDPEGKTLNLYQKYSARIRREALEELDDMLEFSRTQFALELAKRDVDLQVGVHPCQQAQPIDSRRFFFRYYGNSGWRFFIQNGGFYCEAPRFAPSFNDVKYYAYVTISGEYISYTECPDGVCVTSPLIWKAIHENEGDRHMEGAVYRDTTQEGTPGWLATFNWWQCYPHDGINNCENDLIVE